MDLIDERELRNQLLGRPPANVMISTVMKTVLDESIPWEHRRPYWYYLHHTGRAATVATVLIEALTTKMRIPFNVLTAITSALKIHPQPIHQQALLKGMRKHRALDDALALAGWEMGDPRLSGLRDQVLAERLAQQRHYQAGLREKFEFLRNQRMMEQANRVLRRMIEIFPEDESYRELRRQFDEERAREALANRETHPRRRFERTQTVPSTSDQEMIKCFVEEGIRILVEKRELAPDLAVALWFLDDFSGAEEILRWAAPSASVDWMRAEVLFAGRRFLECLDFVNTLEIKYVEDPESTFATAYLRAQCLWELGQEATALENLRSLVRVRPNYRSAHALILEWADGAEWE